MNSKTFNKLIYEFKLNNSLNLLRVIIDVHPFLIYVRLFLIHVHPPPNLNKNRLITSLYSSDVNQEANIE